MKGLSVRHAGIALGDQICGGTNHGKDGNENSSLYFYKFGESLPGAATATAKTVEPTQDKPGEEVGKKKAEENVEEKEKIKEPEGDESMLLNRQLTVYKRELQMCRELEGL